MGVLKLSKLRLPQLWGPITLCVDLRLRWGLKQSCSPHSELCNDMSNATCMQGNRVDSRLILIGSQIANLTPSLFFCHNLCFRCPNGSCKPILDIYISIAFQWFKELLEPLGFGSCNRSLKIQKWKFLWECEGSFPHTFLHSQASLLAHNIASPCLGHEPKAKVMTM
jgi:hypothetical protein